MITVRCPALLHPTDPPININITCGFWKETYEYPSMISIQVEDTSDLDIGGQNIHILSSNFMSS